MEGINRFAIALALLISISQASLYRPAAEPGPSHPQARSYFEARVDLREPGWLAIQKHLATVESDLRAHPPAGLTAAQRAARAKRLDELRAYRIRGVFPRNLDFPDRPMPYFIDAAGVACAVGQLVIASGHRALAEDIARMHNHAYIRQIADPGLEAWARQNGLTVGECARIQPSYVATYPDVLEMHLDSRDRVWIMTGSDMPAGYRSALSYRESGSWVSSFQPEAPRFFCTVGDRALVGFQTAFSWDGSPTIASDVAGTGLRACAASPDGQGFWLGGDKGLETHILEGTKPPRHVKTIRAGVEGFPSDTVTELAWVGKRIWAGTPKSLATRTLQGGSWTARPCSTLGGTYLGGLKAGPAGGIACAGMLKSNPEQYSKFRIPHFSENGLLVLDEAGTLQHHTRKNSALPDDTLFFVAPASDGSIWVCGRQGVFKFTPPGMVTPFPHALPLAFSSMEVGIGNRLHLGTYGASMGGTSAKGVYRLDADSLAWLGHPMGTTSLSRVRREGAKGGRLRLLTVLGRHVDVPSAAGAYLRESRPVTAAPSPR